MDKSLLFDAVERYLNGEMTAEEQNDFENFRKNNPEIDQEVVEHIMFLKKLEHHSDVENLKNTMAAVENKLELEGAVQFRKKKFKAKVVHLWKRYKRTISVAAAAAGVVSILTASGITFLSGNKKTSSLTPLVDNKLHQIENKISQMESKLNDVANPKPAFEANFRATGFLADGKGYIITNAHVVNRARNLIVENIEGDQFSAVSLYSNLATDLAILKITDTTFKAINQLPYNFKEGTSDLAEQIFTLGFPREEVVYNEGYLSAKSGYYGDTASYQVSISVNPGNSGGPVMNKNGEIIGIISSKATDADGVVYATRAKNVFDAIEQINDSGSDTIKLSTQNNIKGHNRVQQIKTLENFVFKVKGN